MNECGAHKAKTYLPELIELEAKGNRSAITEHRVPVAITQPPDNANRANPKHVIGDIGEFRSMVRDIIEIQVEPG
jgi:antitoxin (DNA-binding transcriptional repressor) of toxin-antitoxin stability system